MLVRYPFKRFDSEQLRAEVFLSSRPVTGKDSGFCVLDFGFSGTERSFRVSGRREVRSSVA